MTCLECPNASKCHDDITGIVALLKGGLKAFDHGHFMQADEDFKLAIVRLETIEKHRLGR